MEADMRGEMVLFLTQYLRGVDIRHSGWRNRATRLEELSSVSMSGLMKT